VALVWLHIGQAALARQPMPPLLEGMRVASLDRAATRGRHNQAN
jgi:hypothetical protein